MSNHEREAEIPEDLKQRAREVMAQFSEPTQESYEKQIADLRAQLAAAEKRATNMAHHTGFLIHALMRIEQGETYRPGLRPEFYGHAMALAKATLAAHKTDATAQAVAEVLEVLRPWYEIYKDFESKNGPEKDLCAACAKLAALDKEPQ